MSVLICIRFARNNDGVGGTNSWGGITSEY